MTEVICEDAEGCVVLDVNCGHGKRHGHHACKMLIKGCSLLHCIPVNESQPTVAELMREIILLDINPRVYEVVVARKPGRTSFEARAQVGRGTFESTRVDRGDTPEDALRILLETLEKRIIVVCPECGKPR